MFDHRPQAIRAMTNSCAPQHFEALKFSMGAARGIGEAPWGIPGGRSAIDLRRGGAPCLGPASWRCLAAGLDAWQGRHLSQRRSPGPRQGDYDRRPPHDGLPMPRKRLGARRARKALAYRTARQ